VGGLFSLNCWRFGFQFRASGVESTFLIDLEHLEMPFARIVFVLVFVFVFVVVGKRASEQARNWRVVDWAHLGQTAFGRIRDWP